MSEQLSRRKLGKLALGGAVGATQLGWLRSSFAQEQTTGARPQFSGVKLCCQAPADATDEDLLFYKQLGVDSVSVHARTPEYNTAEAMRSVKKRYADVGLVVDKYERSNDLIGDIVLNRPGRDKAIEDYKTWIHTSANGGFDYIMEMFDVTSAVVSGEVEVRGSQARDCDLNSSELRAFNRGSLLGSAEGSANSPLLGREYSRDEIWANYTYFIKQVTPVLEETGVRIGFHPDDPPVPSLFGMARLFTNFEDCKTALKIANSPNVGMCLCCGTWAEGGAAMGIDPPGAIHYFGSQKQIFEIHFRNVTSPLPHFRETYPDNGFYDQYKIMKALQDVKYDGIVSLDGPHIVRTVDGLRTYQAFGIGYMRALQQRAQRAKTEGTV